MFPSFEVGNSLYFPPPFTKSSADTDGSDDSNDDAKDVVDNDNNDATMHSNPSRQSPQHVDPHSHQRSQHCTILTLVHAKTLSLAKTVQKYPRKHRDLSGVLDDAVEALEEFKGVEWPPRRSEMEEVLESVPSWMEGEEEDGAVSGLGKKMEEKMTIAEEDSSASIASSAINANDDPGTGEEVMEEELTELEDADVHDEEEAKRLHDAVLSVGGKDTEGDAVVAAISPAKENKKENDGENEVEQKKAEAVKRFESIVHKNGENKSVNEKSAPFPPSPDQAVDAAAMEPMHPAVITTLHALCMVISSDSKTPKMAELALECISILTNGRYVSGVAGGRMKLEQQRKMSELTRTDANGDGKGRGGLGKVVPSSNPAAPGHDGRDGGLSFLGYVVESITRASDSSSEVVQGGMAKALLSIMTCPKCGVHEAAMLQAVRSTFHVYLVSKTTAGKELAKRTLVDMLKCVFNRMEAYDIISRDQEATKKDIGKQGANGASNARENGNDDKTVGTASTTVTNGSGRSTLKDVTAPQTGILDDPSNAIGLFASQYHTDSYLLFRALCKLSSKTLPGDENVGVSSTGGLGIGGSGHGVNFFSASTTVDPLALNSKILSLELILAVFEHCGDAFQNGEKFVYAVQSYLCVSLLKNCMSNQTSVAHLSLKIFLLLVRKFKTHLKSEIEVFVANIFLRVLESPNSPFEQKVLVLEALRALCADPLMLTQLFLNYDCDFDAVNLYKDIVHHVTRISARACAPINTSSSATKRDTDQELDLSRTGLEVLVVILRSFLKSLDLPGGDDKFDENDGSSSLSMLRQNLKLDIGETTASIDKYRIKRVPSGMNALEKEDSSENVAEKIVVAFDKKRTAQQNFEIGVVKFTLSPKSGLSFFIENGFVELDAQDMARFLYENSEKLDKTQIGEVLGREPDASFIKEDNVDPERGGKGFFLRVLHHYVDKMEFTGLSFDESIRLFLSGFRLPGEAQKIDRIMEKFAERFTRQNTDVFPSADTAFILAFSVIMLNTDLHNPSIKPERRMTLESFIRNNKGISVDGGDLPEDFLTGIFNRIKEKPFSLKEDDEAREKVSKESSRDMFESLFVFEGPFGSSAEDRKREKFRKEREEMMAASEQMFKKRPSKNMSSRKLNLDSSTQLTDSVSPADVVKPMFDVTWGPLIGTLSQVLESSTNETSIALCLSGFVYSIRLASHSGMSLARNTFVNSLAKFTTLGSIKEMKSKNIECIRTLLSIAIIDGEYLGDSWSPILQCISQLGRLHLFASGLDSEDQFLQVGSPQLTKISEAAREMEENNGKAVLAAVNEVLIDKVFSSSVTLSARGIVNFIDQLVAVSEAEISGDTKRGISGVSASGGTKGMQGKITTSGHGIEGPRIFSLQRLVEVADYNMDIRPRLTWSQIWENMGNHFAKVGCNENAMVSMFAIDALRQLSFKFLEKPELTDFNFQRLFLKPFLLIMENPGSREDIRELVLRCVDNIIRSLAHNLRSGWKIFFSILTLSASDPSAKIKTLGLAILQRLLDEHLDELCRLSGNVEDVDLPKDLDTDQEQPLSSLQKRQRNANADDFVGLCKASLSFVQTEKAENPLPIGLSMRALCHTACYADIIAEKRVLPPVSGFQSTDPSLSGYTYTGLSDDEALEMAIWRPLLDGLAAGICSSAPSSSGGVGCLVQRGSVMALRAILLRHGRLFSVPQWAAILSYVILPAIQIGAENDCSPVNKISSESPSVSSLDFIGEPLSLPPLCDDEGLKKFSAMAQSDESSPSRPLGTAELLVEASFADLRHGGDGNLSKAYRLKKKDVEKRMVHLQPFPDSWIATTAPIALGILSDLVHVNFLLLGDRARDVLWPIISKQLSRWTVGSLLHQSQVDVSGSDHENGKKSLTNVEWQPCEAIVRIACKEWCRVYQSVLSGTAILDKTLLRSWLKTLNKDLSDIINQNIHVEEKLRNDIVESKLASIERQNAVRRGNMENDEPLPRMTHLDLLPKLKSRCIAAHCLQQYISSFVNELAPYIDEDATSHLVDALCTSKLASRDARQDEDLAHAFQEAFFEQWGDGVEEVEAALRGVSASGTGHRGSSQMFFLTQEASATKATVILLSLLYCQNHGEDIDPDSWDAESYAEPVLMRSIMDVLTEFLASEVKDGVFVDPNVWRSASESGGQVAFYCTSFAGVVVHILEAIHGLEREKFERHKESLFPMLCSLVCVQSDEIRQWVSSIFTKQIGPLIGVMEESQ
mmetsp:Transcript_9258/g.19271  ORF Transcript_9258/g.19271 Transcript_9258/m.19271 type:complete len:2226 (+) Transcript_9258:141-6818(+)